MITEIEAIKLRHSVRNYTTQKIEQEKLDLLNAKIAKCNEEGKLHLQLCTEAGNTFNRLLNKAMGLGSAPSVIACVGEDAADLEERVGYYGEQIVLYAQQLGLNTCWAGTYNKKAIPCTVGAGEKIVIAIAIGYGATQGKERKSKRPEQVAPGTHPDWFNRGVEMALLAPTAMNQQRFEIRLGEDGKEVIKDKVGPYTKVDLGIVKYHFEVGKRA